MKRNELIDRLVKEGLSEKTLSRLSDKQINQLSSRMLGEQTSTQNQPQVTANINDPNFPQVMAKLKQSGVKNINVTEEGDVNEDDKKLNQSAGKRADQVAQGAYDGRFKSKVVPDKKKEASKNWAKGKKPIEMAEEEINEADMGLTVKAPKSSGTIFGSPVKGGSKPTTPKKKTEPKEKETEGEENKEGDVDESLHGIVHGAIKDKLTKDLGREPEDHEIEKAHEDFISQWKKEKDDKEEKDSEEEVDEEKPSAGLSKEKKSEVVKKSKKGGDIGKKGKGFEKLADKASKEYGSEEKGEKVAAAAMWKNLKREGVETKNWVKGLVENEYFHNFTSKNEIMELIQSKLTESDVVIQHGPNVKKGHNGVPEFMSYDSIVKSNAPTTKPKPTTKPGTKPTEKPKTPYQPGPGTNPKPKAGFAE